MRPSLSAAARWIGRLRNRRGPSSHGDGTLLEPVFVIGSNRSGTSVVASLLSQHPLLEGLFEGATQTVYTGAGHSVGFCESMHIWPMLRPDDRRRRADRGLPYWALPQYVGETYRARARDARECDALAAAVQRWRTTARAPLIKDQFNTLRIGLIVDVFPRARFVLVTRPWRDFIAQGIHKWATDGSNTRLTPERPLAGYYWHLVNLIARYDLRIYAPDRFTEVWLDDLHAGRERVEQAMQRVFAALGLPPAPLDVSLLEPQWTRPRPGGGRAGFGLVDEILDFEREVLRGLGGRGS